MPAFRNVQIAAFGLPVHPALNTRRPTCAADWRKVSRSLCLHGVPLQTADTPLTDRGHVNNFTCVYLPHTTEMADTESIVSASKPLREYCSLISQRGLLEDALSRTCSSATTCIAFSAWVRY
ncbi:hypothetical protein ABL78_7431 [Leptomonas seymouri]|uniref:Uncharacterized protein n=1 Tax=Leptomonas seymouri TaxID=5684 RepID=A0A0N1HTZ8_LEPSE|nr:hypothetical protein ABL78_7431 [Leptomonas seymouri]|eukprot:KPI83532.1 hypothetical protein ABL78_7431 [Leptomonas seymouri]